MALLGRSRTLFRIFGMPVKVNLSWVFLFALVVFSLSSKNGLFRTWIDDPGLSDGFYWLLGVVGALGLFASIIAHELCHSIVARRTGMPVKGITLFIFGGVSELGDEPPTAGSELLMAIVGPLSSVAIAALFFVLWLTLPSPVALNALFRYLWTVNVMLAAFNSLPAFPLDGGRVVRSILWAITGSMRRATAIAASLGATFGLMMIVGGAYVALRGGVIVGIWFVFIGMFLRQAAQSSLQHTLIRRALEGESVGRFMTVDPVTVTPETSLRRFVDDYVMPNHFAIFPVVDEQQRLIGIAPARGPVQIDQAEWDARTVKDIMGHVDKETQLNADTDAVDALSRLQGESGRRLIVLSNDGRPIGILSLRDLMDFLALKIDLEPRHS